MFDDTISINSVLTSLESTLSIEMSSDMKVSEIIDAAIQRLENTYACSFDRDVYALQTESQLTADNINLLLKDVQQCLAMVSLYTNLKLFHANMNITLADSNYLGYAKEQLLTALKYLQYEDTYKKYSEDIITPLYNTLNNVAMCSVKRMFIIVLMLARLGITEGVAILSQLLYIGGLVV